MIYSGIWQKGPRSQSDREKDLNLLQHTVYPTVLLSIPRRKQEVIKGFFFLGKVVFQMRCCFDLTQLKIEKNLANHSGRNL